MKKMIELIRSAHLTKTQTIIAEYILDHASDACFMTSTEIALALGVSESSVIRFSRSLGYGGYMDFQKDLRRQYQDQIESISSSITIPAQRLASRVASGSNASDIRQHFQNAIKNLERILRDNPVSAFEEAADVILSSKTKYIAATRGNTCLGDYFLLYLKQMLPGVTMTTTASISPIDHMCSVGKTDCLIIFSFPRYSSVDEITAQIAKDAGAKIIVITDKPSALLAQYADVLLIASIDSNTYFNSMVAPQFVAEALLDTVSHKATGLENRLKTIDRYLDKLRNY